MGFDPAEKTGGLGLGLFITRQIATAHGGTIEVISAEGEGTTFRLHLPRTAAASVLTTLPHSGSTSSTGR
ncbi:MAG: ATP-binding protein [Gemmatimonadota bacterium]